VLRAGRIGTTIGRDFMPPLDEGALLLQTVLPPEASLEEVDRMNHRLEDVLREVPEVDDVVPRTGRAERTEDPMPHTCRTSSSRCGTAGAASGARSRTTSGTGSNTCPASACIDEGLGGTPADLAVRIFGPNLETLARLGRNAAALVAPVPGVADVRTEPLDGLPQIRIAVDREAAALVGLSPACWCWSRWLS
jgi:heavy metal efflux system protein